MRGEGVHKMYDVYFEIDALPIELHVLTKECL